MFNMKWRIIIARILIIAMAGNPVILAAHGLEQAGVVLAANQQAAVKRSANGTQVIDIATPGSKGVSHNKFDQFNVPENGLILNNSQGPALSVLGGFTDGNRRLTGGTARLVLAEVVGGNRSSLLGFTEMLGDSAEFILANPNGITCNGCGFINIPRVTLATGIPDLLNGELLGFNISGGDVFIDGTGLNAANVSKFDILTRAMAVNAALYADELNIRTGTGYYDIADSQFTTSGNSSITALSPQFALDASALGAMYTNTISLIGTEAGLGVRSQGLINSIGSLELTADGQLQLKDTIAGKDATLRSASADIITNGTTYGQNLTVELGGTLHNRGVMAAAENMHITAAGLQQTGDLIAGINAKGEWQDIATQHVDVTAEIFNQGRIISQGQQYLSSSVFENSTGALLQADDTELTVTNIKNSGIINSTSLSVIAENTNNSGHIQAQQLNISSQQFLQQDGVLYQSGENGQLSFSGSNLILQGGLLAAEGRADIYATEQIRNQTDVLISKDAVLRAAEIINSGTLQLSAQADLTADILHNSGNILFTGEQAVSLTLTDVLNNQHGLLQFSADATLTALLLNNSDGNIYHLGKGDISLAVSQQFTNRHGRILSNGNLLISAPDFNNELGALSANQLTLLAENLNSASGNIQAEQLSITAQQLDNRKGNLVALGETGESLQLTVSGKLDNSQGLLLAKGQQLTIQSQHIINEQGSLLLAGEQGMTLHAAQQLNNRHGVIQSGGGLHVNTPLLNNEQGDIYASALNIQASQLTNSFGVLAAQYIQLDGEDFDNRGGTVSALSDSGKNLILSFSQRIDNSQQGILQSSGQAVELNSQQLLNHQGNILLAGSDGLLQLNASEIQNTEGKIQTNSVLQLNAQTINNQSGYIAAVHDMTIDSSNLTNKNGRILADSMLLNSTQLDNTLGIIQASADITIHSHFLNNLSGIIRGGRMADIQVTDRINNQQGQLLADQNMTVQTRQLDNTQGILLGAEQLQIDAVTLNNTDGGIINSSQLTLTASTLSNQHQARIEGQQIQLTTSLLDNSGTILATGTQQQSLLLQTDILNNQGHIESHGQNLQLKNLQLSNQGNIYHLGTGVLQLEFLEQLNNRAGEIYSAGQLNISGNSLNNTAGQLSSAKSIILDSGDLYNTSGTIQARDTLAVNAVQVDNSDGVIAAVDGNLQLLSQTINNQHGKLYSGGEQALLQADQIINRDGNIIHSGKGLLRINSQQLDNLDNGQISAAGQLSLNTSQLNNSGNIVSELLQISSPSVVNRGQLASQRLILNATDIVNDGNILTASAEISANVLHNNSLIQVISEQQPAQLQLNATTLNNRGSIVTDVADIHFTGQHFDNREGSIVHLGSGVLHIDVLDQLQNQDGELITAGTMTLESASLLNQGGVIEAGKNIFLKQNNVNNDSGRISAANAITIAARTINNSDGQINAATLDLTANQLDNQQGQILAVGQTEKSLNLNIDDEFNNRQGLIFSAGTDSRITTPLLYNEGGIIRLAADGKVQLQQLNNSSGNISAENMLVLQAQYIDNQQGELSAGRLTLEAGKLDNTQGLILTTAEQGKSFDISITDTLLNTQGQILAMGQSARLNAAKLNNNGGVIALAGSEGLILAGREIDNGSGQISAAGKLELSAVKLVSDGQIIANDVALQVTELNNSGLILAEQMMHITAEHATNTGQLAAQQLLVSAQNVDNSGTIQASGSTGESLILNLQRLRNSGSVISNGTDLNLHHLTFNNNGGSLLHTGNGMLSIETLDTLDNLAGHIVTNGDLRLIAEQLNNQDGLLQIAKAASIDVSALSNLDGHILALGEQRLQLLVQQQLNNRNGSIVAGQLYIDAGSLNNQAGQLASVNELGQALTIQVNGLLDNTTGQIAAAGGDAVLSSSHVLNQDGNIHLAGNGVLQLRAAHIDNLGEAQLSSQGQLNIETQQFVNNAVVVATEHVRIDTTQLNNSGLIQSAELSISAGDLTNRGGQLLALGGKGLAVDVSGVLDNQHGVIASNGQQLEIEAAELDNRQGQIQSIAGLAITADSLDNRQGHISGTTANLVVAQLDNRDNGQLLAEGLLTVHSGEMVNAGLISATTVEIKAEQLINQAEGQMTAEQLQLSAGAAENAGVLYGEHLTLDGGTFTNTGLIQALQQGSLNVVSLLNQQGQLHSQGQLTIVAEQAQNLGGLLQGEQLTVRGQTLLNDGGQILALGGEGLKLTLSGQLENRDGTLYSGGRDSEITAGSLHNSGLISHSGDGTLAVTADVINNQGTLESGGQLTLSGRALDNRGTVSAEQVVLTTEQMMNSGAVTGREVQISSTVLDNRGTVSAEQVQLTLEQLENRGQIVATGEAGESLRLEAETVINRGLLASKGEQLSFVLSSLDNREGELLHLGAGVLSIEVLAGLDNASGQIYSEGNLALKADVLDNRAGEIQGQTVEVASRAWDNRGGQLLALRDAGNTLTVDIREQLDNRGGVIYSAGGKATITAETVLNEQGQLTHSGSGQLTVVANTIHNGNEGVIASNDELWLQSKQLDSAGQLMADKLLINTSTITNTGRIDGRVIELQAGQGNSNNSGVMAAQQQLLLNNGTLSNSGTLYSSGELKLSADTLLNSGTIAQSGIGVLQLDVLDTLSNQQGQILSDAALRLNAATLNNQQGIIQSESRAEINAGHLQNQDGHILALGQQPLTITVQHLLNNQDGTIGADVLALSAGTLDNRSGLLQARDTTIIAGDITNQGGRLISDLLHINATQLSNREGLIAANDSLHLEVTGLLDNRDGELVTTAAQAYIGAQTLNNDGGIISQQSGTLLHIVTGGELSNDGGTIHSAGQLSLSAGELHSSGLVNATTVTVDAGRIENRGAIQGSVVGLSATTLHNDGTILASGTVGESLQLSASDGIINRGHIQSQGQSLVLRDALSNDGGVLVHTGSGVLQLGAVSNQKGTVYSAGQLAIAGGVSNQQGLIQALSGLSVQGGALNNREGVIRHGGELLLDVTAWDNRGGELSSQGARADITVAGELQNDGGVIVSSGQQLSVTAGNIVLGEGTLAGYGQVDVTTGTLSVGKGGQLRAEQGLGVTADTLRNEGVVSGQQVSLDTVVLDNRGGVIEAASQLQVQSGYVNNAAGVLLSQGRADITVSGQQDGVALDNRAGQIIASGALVLNTPYAIENAAGRIMTEQQLTVGGGSLENTAGQLLAGNGLEIALSGGLINHDGVVYSSQGDMVISAQQLSNTGEGVVLQQGAGQMSLTLGSLLNEGEIGAGTVLALTAEQVNNSGLIQSAEIDLTANKVINSGRLLAEQLLISGKQIDNSGGIIAALSAAGTLQITADTLNNQQGLIQGQALTLDTELNNRQGEVLSLGSGSLNIKALADNQQGKILSQGSLALNGAVNNTQGVLQALTDLNITGTTLNNTAGVIHAGGQLEISGTSLNNQGGKITAAGNHYQLTITDKLDNSADGVLAFVGNMSVSAGVLDNRSGNIYQQGDGNLLLTATTVLNNQQGVIVSNAGLTINTAELNNDAGQIAAKAAATLNTNLLSNLHGQIESGNLLNLKGISQLDNSDGHLSAQNITAELSGTLNNVKGTLFAADTLSIKAGNIDNSNGILAANNDAKLTVTGTLNNTSALLQAGKNLNISAVTVNNSAGTIQAGSVELSSQQGLNNNNGTIHGQTVALNTASLNNSYGVLLATSVDDNALQLTGLHSLNNDKGTVASHGNNLNLALTELSNNDGKLLHLGEGTFTLSVADTLNNSGTIASNTNLTLNTGTLINSGTVQAQQQLLLNGGLSNQADAVLAANSMVINAAGKAIDNAGTISATTNLNMQADNIINRHLLFSGNTTTVEANSIVNSGVWSASHLEATGFTLLQNSGRLESNTAVYSGKLLQNLNGGMLVNAGTAADGLQLKVSELNNSGTVYNNARDMRFSGTLTNSGSVIHAGGGNFTLGGSGNINNAGGSIASAGTAIIQSSIYGAGTVYAEQGMQLSSADTFTNQSQLYTKGTMQVNAALHNQGSLLSDGALLINSSGNVTNSGSIQGQNLDLTAAVLNNSGGSITSVGNGDARIITASLNNSNGIIQSTNRDLTISTSAGDINNSSGQIRHSGSGTLLLDSAGNINQQSGSIMTGGQLMANASGNINNSYGVLSAASYQLSATGTFTNNNGQITGSGNAASSISANILNNSDGYIAANGSGLTLTAVSGINNDNGSILLAGNGVLKIAAGSLSNNKSDSRIISNGAIELDAGSLLNNAGMVSAAGALSVNAATVGNTGTLASRGGQLTIDSSGTLTNRGTVSGATGVKADVKVLDNTGGMVQSDGLVDITANSLTVGQMYATNLQLNSNSAITIKSGELLSAKGNLGIISGGNISNSGNITASGALTLGGSELTNSSNGVIRAGSNTTLGFSALNNSGIISGNNNLILNVGNTTNSGTLAAGNQLDINGNIINSNLLFAGNLLTIDGNVSNTSSIYSNGDAIISGNTITNTGGTIAAVRDMSISGNILNTHSGERSFIDGEKITTIKVIKNASYFDIPGLTPGTTENMRETVTEERTVTTFSIDISGRSGVISAGNDLSLNGNVVNEYSTISAVNDLIVSGNDFISESMQNQNVVEIKHFRILNFEVCTFGNCRPDPNGESGIIKEETEIEYTGGAFGTIFAGGKIRGNLSGKVELNNLSPVSFSGDVINTTASGSSGTASRGGSASAASGSNVAVNSNSGVARNIGSDNRSADGVSISGSDAVTVDWRDDNGGGAAVGTENVNIGQVADAKGRQVETLDNIHIDTANNHNLQGQQQQTGQTVEATVKSGQQVQQGSNVSHEQLLAQQFNGAGSGNGAIDDLSGVTVAPVSGSGTQEVTRQQGNNSDYQPVSHQLPEGAQQQLVAAPQVNHDAALQGQQQQVNTFEQATLNQQQQVQYGVNADAGQVIREQINAESALDITVLPSGSMSDVDSQQGRKYQAISLTGSGSSGAQQQASISTLHLGQNALLANEQISGLQQQGVDIDPATGQQVANDPRLQHLPDGSITDGNWHTTLPVSGNTSAPAVNQGVQGELAQVNAGQLLQGQLSIQSAGVQGGTQQVTVNDPARQSATGMQGSITAQGLGFISPDMAGLFAVNGQTPQTTVPAPLQGGGQISNGNATAEGQNPDLTIKNMVDRQQDTQAQQQNSAIIAGQQAGQYVFLTDEQMRVLTEDLGFDADAINKGQQALYASVSQHDLLADGVTLKAGGVIDITADAGFTIDTGIAAGEGLILRSDSGLTMGNSGFFDSENLLGLQLGGDFTNNQNLQSNTLWLDIGGNFTNQGSVIGNDVLSITTGNDLINQNLLSGGHVLLSAGGDIINRTEFSQHTVQNGGNSFSYTTVGNAPQIISSDSLSMAAGNNIDLQGSKFSAAGDISLNAGNDVLLGAVENVSGHEKYFKGGYDIELHRTYDVVSFDAGGNLSISAGNNLVSEGAQFSAGGIAALNAGNDMELLAVVESHYDADKTTKKKTFSKRVTETVSLHEEVQGTTITAGNILLNATVDENGNVVKQNGGNVTAVGATLNAANDIIVFGQDITFTAGQYQDYEYSHSSKSRFGGLKSKSREELAQDALLSGSSVSAGGNLVMRAENDINVLASGLSGENIVLNAFNNVLIAAGEESSIRESRSKSGGFLSGGSLFSSVEQMNATAKITANSASLNASGNIVIEAGSATVIGSSIDAKGKLAVKTDIGGIQVLAAEERTETVSYEQRIKLGLDGLTNALTRPDKLISADNGQVSISLGKAEYEEHESTTTSTTYKGSSLSGDYGVALDSVANILVEGSSINSTEGTVYAKAGDDITIRDATNRYEEDSKSVQGSAEVSAVVQHQAVEVAKAAMAVDDAKDQLKQAESDYRKYQKEKTQLENTLAQLEQDYQNKVPGVSYSDVNEVKALLDDVNSDEAWYLAGIAAATANLASKVTLLAQQTAAAAQSAATYGFNAGLQLAITGSETKNQTAATTSQSSHISGQNILLVTGEEGKTGSVNIQGSHLNAIEQLAIVTGSLDVRAGVNTQQSQSSQQQANLVISQTVWGAAGGPTMNASYNNSQSQDRQTTYSNSRLTGNKVSIVTAGDASIVGGNVYGTTGVMMDIGGDLRLESLQDRFSGSNKGFGISGGVSFAGVFTNENGASANSKEAKTTSIGGTDGVAGVSGGINASTGRYQRSETVLSSITGGQVDINVGGRTDLIGSLIGAQDKDGNDTGKLSFNTGSLNIEHLSNRHYSSNVSAGINGSVGVSDKANPGDPTQSNTNLALNSSTYRYKNESSQGLDKTLATIGQGSIKVGGEEATPEGLNRDVTQLVKEIYSVERQQGNIDLTVDHRLLTEEGRNQIAEDFSKIADKVMETAETLSAFLDELNKASPEMAEYIAGLAEGLQQVSQEHVSNNDQTEQQIAERAEGINQQEADQLLAKEVTLPELVLGEAEAPPMPDKTFEQQQGEFGALQGLLNDYYAESQQYADQNLETGINRGIYAASKNENIPSLGSDIDFAGVAGFYQNQRESAYSGYGLETDAPEGHTGNFLGWKVASIGNESLQFLQFLGESSQSATLAGAVAGLFLPKPEYISLVGEGSLLGKPQSFAGAVGVESGVIDSYFIGAEGLVAFGFKLGAKSASAAGKVDEVVELSSTSLASRSALREDLAIQAGVPRNIFENPSSVWGASLDNLKQSFTMDGAVVISVPPRAGSSGNAQVFKVEGSASGIKEVQYSPSTAGGNTNSTHVGEYYKITMNDGSKVKIVDPNAYRPTFVNGAPIYDKNTVYINPKGQQVSFDSATNSWMPK